MRLSLSHYPNPYEPRLSKFCATRPEANFPALRGAILHSLLELACSSENFPPSTDLTYLRPFGLRIQY